MRYNYKESIDKTRKKHYKKTQIFRVGLKNIKSKITVY